MLIVPDKQRWRRFTISTVVFLVILFMIKFNATIGTTLDAIFQSLFTSQRLENMGWFHALMVLVSFLGSPKMDLIWVAIIAIVLWLRNFRIPAVWAICTIIGGDILGALVKAFVKRARPAQHLASDDGYSFPSGHTLGFFLVVGILFLVVIPIMQNAAKRAICQLLLIFAIFFLAVSRVYLYAHWPADTIGAMLLAYSWLQVAEWLYVAWAPRLSQMPIFSHSIY